MKENCLLPIAAPVLMKALLQVLIFIHYRFSFGKKGQNVLGK